MCWFVIFELSHDSYCITGKRTTYLHFTMIYLGQAGYFCKVSKWVIEVGKTAVNAIPWKQGQKTTCYLTGVLGLPGNFRGERTFGSKENFSLTFSSTDGATYVKPWGRGGRQQHREMWVHFFKDHLSENNPQLMMSNETLNKPYHAMWWKSERCFQERQQD